jgi:hypothetical protein
MKLKYNGLIEDITQEILCKMILNFQMFIINI